MNENRHYTAISAIALALLNEQSKTEKEKKEHAEN